MAQWRMYNKCYAQHSHTLAQVNAPCIDGENKTNVKTRTELRQSAQRATNTNTFEETECSNKPGVSILTLIAKKTLTPPQ